MTKILTEAMAKKALKKDRMYRLKAGGNLYLQVNPTGYKSWKLRYRLDGDESEYSIGKYPDYNVREAQERAEDMRRLIREGEHPLESKRSKKTLALKEKKRTFNELNKRYFEIKDDAWSESSFIRGKRRSEMYIIPFLGDMQVDEIERCDVLAILKAIEKKGFLSVIEKVKAIINGVLDIGIDEGFIKFNIATKPFKGIKACANRNYPHITKKDLPLLLNDIQNYSGHPVTKIGLNLLVLIFIRPGELRHLEWDFISDDGTTLTIPSKLMKGTIRQKQDAKNNHVVHLAPQAQALLEELKEYTGSSRYLFCQQHNDEKVISENTLGKALHLMGYKGRMVPHAFRHVASTIINEEFDFSSDVVEAQLAHSDSDKIRAIYNKAEYLDKRGEMLDAWADYLDRRKKPTPDESEVHLSISQPILNRSSKSKLFKAVGSGRIALLRLTELVCFKDIEGC